ncbi:MAG: hypothetical protein JXR83_19880 [Deltaproteobacteria bacterium]|nr:hypothetical protein [Deltaproteobacteria bacterium]
MRDSRKLRVGVATVLSLPLWCCFCEEIGGLGQPCSANNTCRGDLICVEGICVTNTPNVDAGDTDSGASDRYPTDSSLADVNPGDRRQSDGLLADSGPRDSTNDGTAPIDAQYDSSPIDAGAVDRNLDATADVLYSDVVADVAIADSGLDVASADVVAIDTQDVWSGLGGSDFGPWKELITGTSWGGGISANSGDSASPSLALDDSGNPVVAWADGTSGNYEIYVKRYNGSRWVDIGPTSSTGRGISNSTGYSQSPSLALDLYGNPVVAWSDNTCGNNEIYIKRFDGTHWVDIGTGSSSGGGLSNSATSSEHPSVALDSSGNPVVAWTERCTSTNYDIYIRRFDGVDWVDLGAGSSTGGGISSNSGRSESPSLALDISGNPVVAWSDNTSGNYEIYIKQFVGGGWVDVGAGSSSSGGISDSTGSSLAPSLDLDGLGKPVVAWQDYASGDHEIYVKRFDGSVWADVGEGSSSSGGISNNTGPSEAPSLDLDGSGKPIVAWHDSTSGYYEIYIKRYNGSVWVDVGTGSSTGGGVSDSPGRSYYPSLAVGFSGNPVVAWEESDEIYIKRFDGIAWLDVLSFASSGGGISDNTGNSEDPSLAVDSSGNPVVAWVDDTSGDDEIYVKRFDGSAWVEIGAGSSAGGGVSNNTGYSYNPSIALDDSGNLMVAWSDRTSGNYEIYIKRYNSIYWTVVGTSSDSGGGISNNTSTSYTPSLALDPMGNPVVAWRDYPSSNSYIYVKRFDGALWVDVGSNSSTGTGIATTSSYEPSIALDTNVNPVVAYSAGASARDIYAKHFNGSTWSNVGSNGRVCSNSGSSQHPSLALDSSENPFVAWEDSTSGNYEIYVKRFDGTTWVDLGTGSSSGGGISNSTGISQSPSMALDASENPVVAWRDGTSGKYEIYVRRFDGSEWVEIGQGSASGGGVSNNSLQDSSAPSLSIGGGRICVAWYERGRSSTEIVMRCAAD